MKDKGNYHNLVIQSFFIDYADYIICCIYIAYWE